MKRIGLAGGLLAAVAMQAQLPRESPAGLVMAAGGSVTRAPRMAAAAPPGEVLLAGDVVTAGNEGLEVLSCAERRIVKLSPMGQATVTEQGLRAKRGLLMVQRMVGGCFLPPVRRMPVAGPQHLGATSMRAGPQEEKQGSLEERIAKLGEQRAAQVRAKLAQIEGGDTVAWISRGSVLEGAGLLGDASEAYVKAAEMLPDAVWLRSKVIELDDALLKRANR